MEEGHILPLLLTVTNSASPLGPRLALIFFLILFNGFFSASEMAIVTLNPSQVQIWNEEGKKNASLLYRFMQNQGNFLATIQIGVTLAGFLSAAFGAESLSPYLLQLLDSQGRFPWMNTLAMILTTSFISFLSLIFGELIPKRIGMAYPEAFALSFAKVLRFFDLIFRPLSKLLNSTVDFISRLLGLSERQADQVTEEEICLMTEAGRRMGSIQGEEATFISKVFTFDDKEVREIMTPRTAVEALPLEADWELVRTTISQTKFSRFPIYDEDIDDIVGVVHVADFFRRQAGSLQDLPHNFRLQNYLRPAYFVPESKLINVLMREMRQDHVTLAVVIDEFGGVDGIVTLEDLLEELVGDIEDEFDDRYIPLVFHPNGAYSIDARMTPEEAAAHIPELAQILREDADFDTMAGLVLSQLDRIPGPDDHPEFELGPLSFKVEEMDGRRIAKVLVQVQDQGAETTAKNQSATGAPDASDRSSLADAQPGADQEAINTKEV